MVALICYSAATSVALIKEGRSYRWIARDPGVWKIPFFISQKETQTR